MPGYIYAPHLRNVRNEFAQAVKIYTSTRILREQYPDTNISGSMARAYGGYSQHCVLRFLSLDGDDSDPDAVLGYWALRTPRIRLSMSLSLENNVQYSTGVAMAIVARVWLLDQHFGYTAITWNSPPPWTGVYQDITLTCALDDEENVRVRSAADGGDQWCALEYDIPRLSDGRPVPIYGAAVQIIVSYPDADSIDGRCSLKIEDVSDDELVPGPSGALVSGSYTPYSGEFLPL
jgi:hypothetical protein